MGKMFSFINLSPIWWMVAAILGFALGITGLFWASRTKRPALNSFIALLADVAAVVFLLFLLKRVSVYF